MLKFLRKKEEEEAEEKDLLGEKPKRTRRKKKEEPKPWGKKERLLVGLFLGISVIGSGILALSAREWKLPDLPRIQLPSADLSLEETIILEAPSTPTPQEQVLIEKFRNKTTPLSGVYGFYVHELNSGRKYGLYGDEDFPAGNLVQLLALITLYRERDNGAIEIDDISQRIKEQTDEDTHQAIVEMLGQRKIVEITSPLGMYHTDLEQAVSTPQDIVKALETIAKDGFLEQESREELIEMLTTDKSKEGLAGRLPEKVKVAEIYGKESGILNAAGIVFADQPYVVVIMSKGTAEDEADEIFPELSEEIYEFIN